MKTQLWVTTGLSRDLVDDAQLVQGYLKEVGIEAELKLQEHGAYMSTTMQGKFEGLVRSPFGIAWAPDAPLIAPLPPTPPGMPPISMIPSSRPC